MTRFGQFDGAVLLIHMEIFVNHLGGVFNVDLTLKLSQLWDDGIDLAVGLRAIFSRTRNNQRRARLIDQD